MLSRTIINLAVSNSQRFYSRLLSIQPYSSVITSPTIAYCTLVKKYNERNDQWEHLFNNSNRHDLINNHRLLTKFIEESDEPWNIIERTPKDIIYNIISANLSQASELSLTPEYHKCLDTHQISPNLLPIVYDVYKPPSTWQLYLTSTMLNYGLTTHMKATLDVFDVTKNLSTESNKIIHKWKEDDFPLITTEELIERGEAHAFKYQKEWQDYDDVYNLFMDLEAQRVTAMRMV